MTGSILYMGDTSLDSAAAYLAGLISACGWEFDYVPSHDDLSATTLEQTRALYVISDYPSSRVSPELQQRIVGNVESGAGLLMIGGWESFHGLGGEWDNTLIGDSLPVLISSSDDRVNCDDPVFVRPTGRHPIAEALPWDERPPLIGGFNRVQAKQRAVTVLHAERFRAGFHDAHVELAAASSDPLLVVGRHGAGRTAAFMSDVAPHWVGPLVDWGPERLSAGAPGAEPVEVGNLYAQFFRQLLNWTAGAT